MIKIPEIRQPVLFFFIRLLTLSKIETVTTTRQRKTISPGTVKILSIIFHLLSGNRFRNDAADKSKDAQRKQDYPEGNCFPISLLDEKPDHGNIEDTTDESDVCFSHYLYLLLRVMIRMIHLRTGLRDHSRINSWTTPKRIANAPVQKRRGRMSARIPMTCNLLQRYFLSIGERINVVDYICSTARDDKAKDQPFYHEEYTSSHKKR
jgi:hypothetical protein